MFWISRAEQKALLRAIAAGGYEHFALTLADFDRPATGTSVAGWAELQNAHQRLGRLEYLRNSEKTNTHVSLHVDHYVGDREQAHLLSLFGGDAEVGAVSRPAALSGKERPRHMAAIQRAECAGSYEGHRSNRGVLLNINNDAC
jgi:hypothetical protein